jgi:CheY-like chemotaxis protein
MDAPDVIDETAIQRLHRIGGNELVGELISIFLRSAPERIASALAGTTTGNMSQVLLAVHSLKSSCANVGARRMRQLAVEIETLALDGDATALPGRLHNLEEAFQKVRPLLEHRSDHPPQRSRIAVVEDNADNRLLVRCILEPTYDVAAYETGAEALADLHKQCPSLLLLDISLPGLDGYAVLKAIRADTKFSRLPVVALTAHAMAGDRDRILAAGFDDYVAKPIDDESILLSCITRLLKQ